MPALGIVLVFVSLIGVHGAVKLKKPSSVVSATMLALVAALLLLSGVALAAMEKDSIDAVVEGTHATCERTLSHLDRRAYAKLLL